MTPQSILDRLKTTTEQDRYLDADIAMALGHTVTWRQANYTMVAYPVIYWKAPHPYAGMKEPCPEWTASVDACLRLIRQMLPGWLWTIESGGDGDFGVTLVSPSGENKVLTDWIVGPPTIALLTALFSAAPFFDAASEKPNEKRKRLRRS